MTKYTRNITLPLETLPIIAEILAEKGSFSEWVTEQLTLYQTMKEREKAKVK